MAKRFTDTEKWKKPFIRSLQGAYKLLWMYICDDCDHAGIWQVDIEIAGIRVGDTIDEKKAVKLFGEKIILLDNGSKWFIPSFIEFQYPSGLNPDNKAHGGIIKVLNKYNLIDSEFNLLTSPLQGDKDMVMDKEQDMVTVKVKEEKPVKILQPKKTLFRDSEYFDKEKLRVALWGTQYETANIEYYHETILNWSDGKGEKRIDWLAVARTFMGGDMKAGKYVDQNFKTNINGNQQAHSGNSQQHNGKRSGADILAERINANIEKLNGGGEGGFGG